ncbi:MAG: RES domain-containing protein [Deltaproteobacteria bacterium]|nr:RES domain-containing protein [Deltaproteobacteria bacterium]MBW2100387.1 RES domain-containing protein [Deltaproteobacteria bacterium]
MTVTAWRIVQSRWADTAFSGYGARLEGGRWNFAGISMVYTAESLALSSLEMIVHLPEDALLYSEYVRIPVRFDTELMTVFPRESLPSDWNSIPESESTQKLGTAWAEKNESLILKIPSSVVPEEHNYLINPRHPDYHKLFIGEPAPFRFDPRLIKS